MTSNTLVLEGRRRMGLIKLKHTRPGREEKNGSDKTQTHSSWKGGEEWV
jgi:hypothetical protein